MENFITTTDVETKNKLLSLGFQEVSNSSGRYTFLNRPNVMFDGAGVDAEKIDYSNMLCI